MKSVLLECCAFEIFLRQLFRDVSAETHLDTYQVHHLWDFSSVSLYQLFSMRGPAIKLAPITENNYPELLGRVTFYNAPFIFTSFFSFIKLLLSERTLAKVQILGAGQERELLKDIEEDQLAILSDGSLKSQAVIGMPQLDTILAPFRARKQPPLSTSL